MRSLPHLLSVAIALLASTAPAAHIAYIHGDVAEDGTTPAINAPSGPTTPYDQMLLTDTGNTGTSQFKTMVETEGYTISQHYDQTTTLDATFLTGVDVVMFSLHQKVWSAPEKAALDTWIRAGGAMLIYSDSASGGKFNVVGSDNPVGQNVANNLIAPYGMEVTVDQANGVRAFRAGAGQTHPITFDRLVLEGEGVSPVAVDPTSTATVLIPFIRDPEYEVGGSVNPLVRRTQGITIANPQWAVLAENQIGDGIVMAMFDRQPMWNNGPGSHINKRDNRELLRRIVRHLAGEPTIAPLAVSAGPDRIIAQAGTARLSGSVAGGATPTIEWDQTRGPGTATFASSSTAASTATFDAPGIYTLQMIASDPTQSASDTVHVQVLAPSEIHAALNCGGGSFSAFTGIQYTADTGFFTGGHIDNFPGNSVSGTDDSALYNTAHSNFTAYTVPLANGTYRVLDQFAETFHSTTNKRVFDIALEGTIVLDDLDLVATAPGKWVAHDRTFDVTITDGALNLTSTASVNNSLLNALVVLRSGGPETPAEFWQEQRFGVNPDPATEATQWGWTAQPLQNGMTNLESFAFGGHAQPGDIVLAPQAQPGTPLILAWRQHANGTGTLGADYTAQGVTYQIEFSQTLSPWTPEPATLQLLTRTPLGNGLEQVTARIQPASNPTQGFTRLLLQLAP